MSIAGTATTIPSTRPKKTGCTFRLVRRMENRIAPPTTPMTNKPVIAIACSTVFAVSDVGPRCSARMASTIIPMPNPSTLPGSTRVSQSKESNGTNGRPAIFHPAKKIPTSAAVTIEVTNRPPDISRGNPLNFMQQRAPSRRAWRPSPDRAGNSARKMVCASSGKAPFHPYRCLARRTSCTHSAMARATASLSDSA